MAKRPRVATLNNLTKQLTTIGDAFPPSPLQKGPKASGRAGFWFHDVALRQCFSTDPSLNAAPSKTKLKRNLPYRLPGIIQRSDFVKNCLTVCAPGQYYDLFPCFIFLVATFLIVAS